METRDKRISRCNECSAYGGIHMFVWLLQPQLHAVLSRSNTSLCIGWYIGQHRHLNQVKVGCLYFVSKMCEGDVEVRFRVF
jgi:hypothetical protein